MAKIGWGAMLGAVGGILALVGTLLPWVTIAWPGGLICDPSCTFIGVTSGIGGLLVLVFAIIGLIMVLLPKPVMALLGLIFGILALLFGVLGYVGLTAVAGIIPPGSNVTVTVGYGIYLSLVGALLLVVGGAVAYGQTKKVAAAPMPMPMSPPPPA